jgi:hypothetical protein
MWAHDLRSPAYAERLDRIDAGLVGPSTYDQFDPTPAAVPEEAEA